VNYPLLQFSLRELLGCVSAICGVLIAYTLFGFLGVSVAVVVIGLVLTLLGRRASKPGITWLGVILLVPSFCFTCLAILGIIFLGIGPVYSAHELPFLYIEMVKTANADITEAKVYCLGDFIDSEHVWRLKLSPGQLEKVVAKYGLATIQPQKVPTSFWRAFPFWWRPSLNSNSRFLATVNFPSHSRGPDGEHCFAMYDSQEQLLYVWYKLNF
jgi:hypothetical protein